MTGPLRFRPEVVDDLRDGAKYYDNAVPGLGAGFLAACEQSLQHISEAPERVAADAKGVRSARIQRFPYIIHYRIERDVVVVFAVMFGGRDPSKWQDRL